MHNTNCKDINFLKVITTFNIEAEIKTYINVQKAAVNMNICICFY